MKKTGKTTERTVRVSEVSSSGAHYKYTLLVKESDRVASFRLPLYSIRIEMRTADGRTTEAHTGEIFADLGKAVVFYERLVDNLATPINLAYILEDATQGAITFNTYNPLTMLSGLSPLRYLATFAATSS